MQSLRQICRTIPDIRAQTQKSRHAHSHRQIEARGLAALVRVHKAARTGGGLVLRDPTNRVMHLLQMTGLDRVFAIATS